MTKYFIASLAIATLICGPALADAPPAPLRPTLKIDLRVDADKESRHYGILLVEPDCGSIRTQTQGPIGASTTAEEIKICARQPSGPDALFEIEWKVRTTKHEIETKSSARIAHGSSLALDAGAVKLVVSLQ